LKAQAFLFEKVFYICVMAQLFKTKPLMVEAIQWNGNNRSEVSDFCTTCYFTLHGHVKDLMIDPLESNEVVCINDFIVKTVTGKFVLYTPEAFIATFENV
jgi:hypothetical protein